jgi:putative SOS response-associated peptidase YedK
MCGRYSVLTEDEIIEVRSIIQELSLRLVRDDLENYEARPGEVRPTDKAPVITQNKDGVAFESARFGFKKWDGKGVIINARSETMQSKSMFSKNVGRCVVPASEYYEWKVEADNGGRKKPVKLKHFVKDKEGNLLFFAGLYRDGDDGREFVIITKEPCGEIVDLHDRMPVCLRVNQIEEWLNGKLTPDEIVKMEFNASAYPCEEPPSDPVPAGGSEQISLF